MQGFDFQNFTEKVIELFRNTPKDELENAFNRMIKFMDDKKDIESGEYENSKKIIERCYQRFMNKGTGTQFEQDTKRIATEVVSEIFVGSVKKFDPWEFARLIAYKFRNVPKDKLGEIFGQEIISIEENIQYGNIRDNILKRKIIEMCWTIFKEKTLPPDIHKEAIRRILKGENRKYDMSVIYEGDISQQETPFDPPFDGIFITKNKQGKNITIQTIGGVKYSNAFLCEGHIIKYSITIQERDATYQYEVFSNINLMRMQNDKKYSEAVLEQLLSRNNIEFSNAGGYIGEIVSTSYSFQKLTVGEEHTDRDGGYRFQISEDYALVYEPEPLTAIAKLRGNKVLGGER